MKSGGGPSGGKGTTPRGFAKGKRPNQSFVTTPAMALGGKGKKGGGY